MKRDNKQAGSRFKDKQNDDLVQVDVFMIPAASADMYTSLRLAVAQDARDYWSQAGYQVETVHDPEEGEGLAVMQEDSQEILRFYLNPWNISQAQKARDKDQLDKYLMKYQEEYKKS